jgi:hypothetical protein
MPFVTITSHCPRWCARDHSHCACETAFYHASEATSVAISRPGDLAAPDRLDVQVAEYLLDEPGDPSSSAAVEIAVHAGGRYRLIGLTPAEARELAGMLATAADMLSVPAGEHRPAARPY